MAIKNNKKPKKKKREEATTKLYSDVYTHCPSLACLPAEMRLRKQCCGTEQQYKTETREEKKGSGVKNQQVTECAVASLSFTQCMTQLKAEVKHRCINDGCKKKN